MTFGKNICGANLDCKTAPSFAKSPKIGDFDRVLARGREMGERSEKGVVLARPRAKTRSKTPIFVLLAKEGAVLKSSANFVFRGVYFYRFETHISVIFERESPTDFPPLPVNVLKQVLKSYPKLHQNREHYDQTFLSSRVNSVDCMWVKRCRILE